MDNRIYRSVRTSVALVIGGGLMFTAFCQAQADPGSRAGGAYPYPPIQYYELNGPGYADPGPYAAGQSRWPEEDVMRPGQSFRRYGMGGPSSHGPGMADGPDRMRRPQGGPGQMGGPEMMSGPWGGSEPTGGPGMMSGWPRGPGQMGGPDMMRGPQGGPGQMGGPGMMTGWPGGPGHMGGPDMMGGPPGEPVQMGGPAMAMLEAIAQMDLTSEQRKKLDALKTDLQQRQQELLGKIAEASEKLREVSRQQSLATRNLSDLRGHMMMANMDTANRAEEMLTVEQRQILMRQGAHTMTPEQIRPAK